MPRGRRQSSNTMLVPLITFVGLFIVVATVAVVFYIQAEDYRQEANNLREQRQELVSNEEWTNRGAIIGTKQRTETYLGKMVSYLDEMASLILGGLPEQRSAEAKAIATNMKFQNTLEVLSKENNIQPTDPNTGGLIWLIEELKTNLDNKTKSERSLNNQLAELQIRFDNAMSASIEKEQTLLAEKEKYQQQVEEIRNNYDELRDLMEQSTEEQVLILVSQFEQCQTINSDLNQKLMKTEAELKVTQAKMELAQKKLEVLIPPPDSNVAAYKPDGKILLIDNQTKMVHLNIGSDSQVYQGLTFSVYDKNMPIPKNGKGKAEIEVFNVGENICAARITDSDIKNPIIVDDIVINLIWDEDKTNTFVIAGDFDFGGNGVADLDGPEKIKSLVNKWGGIISRNVSVETDYIVLGQEPRVLRRPTFEEMGIDPLAEEKYNASVQRSERYQDVQEEAKGLSIPVFNTERFLYFIGYKSQAGRPGAFN